MRILFAIPHYVGQPPGAARRRHGSHGQVADRRAALSHCVGALHQLYGPAQCMMQLTQRKTTVANEPQTAEIHIVICTTRGRHLLDELSVSGDQYQHFATDAEPELLGFECHGVLRDRWGNYDYYGYLEDDLILHDPWLFVKLRWFNGHVGQDKLLLPNRFEHGCGPLVHRAYVDGDLAPHVTAPYQNVDDCPKLESEVMGAPLVFRRPFNPHAGCFFLNAQQMQHWMRQPFFLDRATSFIGPLESAATLGIMRAFKTYKPAPPNANFLEIEHHGSQFLNRIRRPDSDPRPD